MLDTKRECTDSGKRTTKCDGARGFNKHSKLLKDYLLFRHMMLFITNWSISFFVLMILLKKPNFQFLQKYSQFVKVTIFTYSALCFYALPEVSWCTQTVVVKCLVNILLKPMGYIFQNVWDEININDSRQCESLEDWEVQRIQTSKDNKRFNSSELFWRITAPILLKRWERHWSHPLGYLIWACPNLKLEWTTFFSDYITIYTQKWNVTKRQKN